VTGGIALLALVTDAFGGRGGIAQYNRDFLTALVETGTISSITVVPRHAPDGFTSPALIRQLPPRPHRIRYAVAAVAAALSSPVDVVFCGHLHMAPLAAVIARLARAKLIVQAHGIEAWPRPTPLRRLGVAAADLVLCVSRYTRAAVLCWAPIMPERVIVVPNTVGDRFTPGDGSPLRRELRLTGKQILLSVGRMDARERYKGYDRVIAAMPYLIARGHDVVYVIVGEGDDRGRLEALAHELHVSERVTFLGAVGSKRLVEAYRMADLFVLPSTGEGFGIAFLEALASGTPALGLSAAGARDPLADGELGACVSEAEFVDTMSRLLAGMRPDPATLSAAVRARFGRDAFGMHVRAAIMRPFPFPPPAPAAVAP
jgi:phosphatidylinositol alpha-1,6-mannosyltransferase